MKYNQKHHDEAKAQGAILIGAGSTKQYRTYKLPCEHEQELQVGHMRNGKVTCRTCMDIKFKKEATNQGATIVGSGSSSTYRTYKLSCGHLQEISLHKMRIGGFKCSRCLKIKLNEEAVIQGCILLGVGSDRWSKNYKLSCGHEQSVRSSEMRIGGFKCKTCLNIKHHDEANAQGATIIGSGSNNKYYTYKLSCDHAQEVRIDNMRIGRFTCHTCQETCHTKPSYVYLLKISKGKKQWLKLGYSKNVDNRSSEYGLPKAAIAENIVNILFPTGAEAREFENSLHYIYKKAQLSKCKAKSLGMVKQGFTECYPVGMLETLTNEFR